MVSVTRYIIGLKKEESDLLLKFLYDHIAYGQDFHVRVRWTEKAVVVWDVRRNVHTHLVIYIDESRIVWLATARLWTGSTASADTLLGSLRKRSHPMRHPSKAIPRRPTVRHER